MAGHDTPESPAWWPVGGINRPASPPKWWPEGGINNPQGAVREAGGGLAASDPSSRKDASDENVVAAMKTTPSSPGQKPKRRTSLDDPFGAPVVQRKSPENDLSLATQKPTRFDPLENLGENLTETWRFIAGRENGKSIDFGDAFGEFGGEEELTSAVDTRFGLVDTGKQSGDTVATQPGDTQTKPQPTQHTEQEEDTWGDDVASRAESSVGAGARRTPRRFSPNRERSDSHSRKPPPLSTAKVITEAARKTLINKKAGGGWGDAHKAAVNVLRLLQREMKPLGMEGVSTFDPLSGLMLYREYERFAAARKRAVHDLYRPSVDCEFGARGRGREDLEAGGDTETSTGTGTGTDTGTGTGPSSTSVTHPSTGKDEHPEKLREKKIIDKTLPELRLGARHAAAAYGSLAAILENNSVKDKTFGLVGAVRDAIVAQGDGDVTEKRATEAAARSAKICVKDFVSADWVTLPFSPASYVAVDRAGGKVVLAIRGTVSTGDLLTDAVSTSTPFLGGWAHSGMVMSAYQVCKVQVPNAAAALVANPTCEFLVTGHSMGAGVGAILTMLIHAGDCDVMNAAKTQAMRAAKLAHPDDDASARQAAADAMQKLQNVKCHCFAAPSVCSLDLSLKARAHTISVVAGKDLIPRLCYAAVRRLLRRLNAAAPSQPVMRAIAAALGAGERNEFEVSEDDDQEDEETLPENTLMSSGKVSGSYEPSSAPPNVDASASKESQESKASISKESPPKQDSSPSYGPRRPNKKHDAKESRCQGSWDDVSDTRGLELRDHFASDFLTQPGMVIHLRHLTSDKGPSAECKHPTAFSEIPISTRMMADHVPMVYQSAIDGAIARRAREASAEKELSDTFCDELAKYGPGGAEAFHRGTEWLACSNKERDETRRVQKRRRRRELRSLRVAMFGNGENEDFCESNSETPVSETGKTKTNDDDTQDKTPGESPGERLWSSVIRTLNGGMGGGENGGGDGDEDDVSKHAAGTDDWSSGEDDAISDARKTFPARCKKTNQGQSQSRDKKSEQDEEDAWSEDSEADLLAAVAEMLGLELGGAHAPGERETTMQRSSGGSQNNDATEFQTRTKHARQPSWGLGRLSRLVGRLKRDADAMFTDDRPQGADEPTADHAFEVDGYVRQATRDSEGGGTREPKVPD